METRTRILIVDNDPQSILDTSQILKKAGYEVLGAQTGNECLRTARAKEPAIILISSALSDTSGIDLSREIRRDPVLSDAYVVFVAPEGTPSSIQARALENGADASLPRTVTSRELLAWIEAVLRRREVETSLLDRVQRMSSAFHALPDPACLVDQKSRIVECNVALSKFLDRPPSEIVGNHYRMIYGGAEPVPGPVYERVLRQRRTEELQAMVRDRRNQITITPLIDEEDRLVGTLHMLSDRSQQQLLEDHNEESNAALERTSEQLHQQMEGRQQAELALSQAHTRMEKQAADNLSALAKLQGTLRSTEKTLNNTQRELTKLQSESRLGRMDAAGRLAGGVAAQLNEWLSGILGSADIGLTQLETSYPGHGELTAVQRLARRAVEWTGRLSNVHRRRLPASQAVDLNELISGQSKVLDRLAGEGVDLELDLAADLSPVKGEPHLLEHALLNLAEQARIAMPDSGVLRFHTEAAKVRAPQARGNPEAQAGKHVRLTVSDNSAGLDPETLEHLFEPFAPGASATEGNPLGMAEVHGIVRQHGGWIEVKSEPGHGTRYDIYLPLHQAVEE